MIMNNDQNYVNWTPVVRGMILNMHLRLCSQKPFRFFGIFCKGPFVNAYLILLILTISKINEYNFAVNKITHMTTFQVINSSEMSHHTQTP